MSSISDETPARTHRAPGHFWADNEILDDYLPAIGIYAFAVYMFLARYVHNQTGRCDPSIETIARKLGISAPTVKKALKTLEQYQLIRSERRSAQHGATWVNLTNMYTLCAIQKAPTASRPASLAVPGGREASLAAAEHGGSSSPLVPQDMGIPGDTLGNQVTQDGAADIPQVGNRITQVGNQVVLIKTPGSRLESPPPPIPPDAKLGVGGDMRCDQETTGREDQPISAHAVPAAHAPTAPVGSAASAGCVGSPKTPALHTLLPAETLQTAQVSKRTSYIGQAHTVPQPTVQPAPVAGVCMPLAAQCVTPRDAAPQPTAQLATAGGEALALAAGDSPPDDGRDALLQALGVRSRKARQSLAHVPLPLISAWQQVLSDTTLVAALEARGITEPVAFAVAALREGNGPPDAATLRRWLKPTSPRAGDGGTPSSGIRNVSTIPPAEWAAMSVAERNAMIAAQAQRVNWRAAVR